MTTRATIDPVNQREGILNNAKLYLGNGDRKAPLVSPLYADLTNLPPLLIQVGESEVLLDDSKRLAERAKRYGGRRELGDLARDDSRVAAVRSGSAGGPASHRTHRSVHPQAPDLTPPGRGSALYQCAQVSVASAGTFFMRFARIQ
jgi:hypothetical protein